MSRSFYPRRLRLLEEEKKNSSLAEISKRKLIQSNDFSNEKTRIAVVIKRKAVLGYALRKLRESRLPWYIGHGDVIMITSLLVDVFLIASERTVIHLLD